MDHTGAGERGNTVSSGWGKLLINEEDPDRYFSAQLWGTTLSAAKDAVIVFYSVTRDPDGKILEISFNFVARSEFDKTYDIIPG